jgi:PAS domain S-box-containing protein
MERRSAFRASLVVEPLWRRLVLAALALVAYAGAFAPLYQQAGVGVSALSIFPVVILAWLFGAWGGLLAGVLIVPINALLLQMVGAPGWIVVLGEGGGEGSALVLVVGCVIGLLRDLGVRLDRHFTDWRRAELALRESEDRFRILFERSRDPIYISRPDGRLVEANEAMVRLLGYSTAELLELDVVTLYEDPSDRQRFAAEIERRGYVEEFPVRLLTRDGNVRESLVSATARRGPDNEIIEYHGTIHDVSDDRALHELAERRTKELQDAVSELESFSYSVSHDLRTHLVTMLGFGSLLWSEHREALDEKGEDFLRRILAAGHRMDRFVRDLLNFSMVSRAVVRPQRLDPGELVAEAIEALDVQIRERGADVAVEGNLPHLQADRTLLARVLENLLSNALKFVPEERTPTVRIRGHVEPGGRTVRIEVEDNGVGLDAAEVPRAFRAFERLDPTAFPGTGVGLSIVQRSVERLGGSVGVQSRPGKGSTFWIVLPAVQGP